MNSRYFHPQLYPKFSIYVAVFRLRFRAGKRHLISGQLPVTTLFAIYLNNTIIQERLAQSFLYNDSVFLNINRLNYSNRIAERRPEPYGQVLGICGRYESHTVRKKFSKADGAKDEGGARYRKTSSKNGATPPKKGETNCSPKPRNRI